MRRTKKLNSENGVKNRITTLGLALTMLSVGILLTACQANLLLSEIRTRVHAAQTGGTKTPPAATYTVTYDANGAESGTVPVDNNSYEKGQSVTVLGNSGGLAKTGYNFISWNLKPDGTGPSYAQGDTLAIGSADVTLYAKWNAKSWHVVGSAGFSSGQPQDVSLAIDSLGTPYVAFTNVSVAPYAATVMRYTGGGSTGWETVGSVHSGTGNDRYTSLALDSSDTPYVAYSDGGNSGHGTVKKYSGGSWQQVGSTDFGSTKQVATTSLAFDSSDTPYVAYVETTSAPHYAYLSEFTGGSWTTVGSAAVSSSDAAGTSVAIDSSNTPYVAYAAVNSSNNPTVMYYGSGWEPTTGLPSLFIAATSIAVDPSDTPYVAFIDDGDVPWLYAYSGGKWNAIGSSSLSGLSASNYISLVIDSSGTPFLAFRDPGKSNKVTVLGYSFSGGYWRTVGASGFSAGAASYVSLSIDPSGTLYVAYGDGGNSNKVTVMAYR